MKTEQTFSELVEPLKKLIRCTKPNTDSLDGWLKFVQVDDVQMSVDVTDTGIYTFVITREPDLGLKVSVDKRFHLLAVPAVIGQPQNIIKTVVRAINKLEG